MNRRNFLKAIGLGSVAAVIASKLPTSKETKVKSSHTRGVIVGSGTTGDVKVITGHPGQYLVSNGRGKVSWE